MKLDISLVPPGMLTQTVAGLLPQLKKASDLTSGRSSVDDIVRAVYSGVYSLWVVYEPENMKLHGFFVTEIKQYPQCKLLCVQHCVIEAGLLKQLEPRVEALGLKFAKDAGCAGIEFVGRPGWRKYSRKHGYASHSVVYQRFFEATHENLH